MMRILKKLWHSYTSYDKYSNKRFYYEITWMVVLSSGSGIWAWYEDYFTAVFWLLFATMSATRVRNLAILREKDITHRAKKDQLY